MRSVTHEQFDAFLATYPRTLAISHKHGVYPVITVYTDHGARWPDNEVASFVTINDRHTKFEPVKCDFQIADKVPARDTTGWIFVIAFIAFVLMSWGMSWS